MTAYSRPKIAAPVFRDAAGDVIPYGERWRWREVPDEYYSVTSNLERFQPLHTVAEALIAHLVDNFDVTVSDDLAYAAGLMLLNADIIRAVRLTPANSNGAPLTFVFTTFPSVIVRAGAVTEILFPLCGCDACDEEWQHQAVELEWQVLAVAAGKLQERQTSVTPPRFAGEIAAVDGLAKSGFDGATMEAATPERLAAAVAMLAEHPDGWVAWAKSCRS